MTFPLFPPGDDPGPSFMGLLHRQGFTPPVVESAVEARLPITHGTTVVAIRYADGAVMAGDRRATSGNLISHRTIEKVFLPTVTPASPSQALLARRSRW